MNIKDYLISLMFAMLGAILVVFFIWLFSLISWAIVWAALVFVLIPVMNAAINLWRNENCYDWDDFFSALFKDKKKNHSNSIIGDENDYEDWH